MSQFPADPNAEVSEVQPSGQPQRQRTAKDEFIASNLRGGTEVHKFGSTTFKGQRGSAAEAAAMHGQTWEKMDHGAQMEWLNKNGISKDIIAAHVALAPPVAQLPERLRTMPNQPDMNASRPGNKVAERFTAMADQQAATRTAARTAVFNTRAAQILNPESTVDAARAVRADTLAKDGITDLGGGTKAMSNKYGTGFAKQLSPEDFAKRKPGVIRDEKGTVAVKAMMAGKNGVQTAVPYVAPQNSAVSGMVGSPTAGNARAATQKSIQSQIATAIPGAAQRLGTDRTAEIAGYKASVADKVPAAQDWLASKQPKAEVTAQVPASAMPSIDNKAVLQPTMPDGPVKTQLGGLMQTAGMQVNALNPLRSRSKPAAKPASSAVTAL